MVEEENENVYAHASGMGYVGNRLSLMRKSLSSQKHGSSHDREEIKEDNSTASPLLDISEEKHIDFFTDRDNDNIFLETSKEQDERVK